MFIEITNKSSRNHHSNPQEIPKKSPRKSPRNHQEITKKIPIEITKKSPRKSPLKSPLKSMILLNKRAFCHQGSIMHFLLSLLDHLHASPFRLGAQGHIEPAPRTSQTSREIIYIYIPSPRNLEGKSRVS